jgi:hypothetical protein
MSSKPTFGSFNQGQKPTIACFNKAQTALGVDLDKLIDAMQAYVDNFVVPVWGTPAKLVRSEGFIKDAWAIVFLDNADQAGVLAYHDLTPDGLPQSNVFVKTTLDNGELVSVSASHELVEMLVDPAINLMTTGPDRQLVYAYESADPVEGLSFKVNDIPMSNFVYPSYFEIFHKAGSVAFDAMNAVTEPFQVLKGGYQITFQNGEWKEVFAAKDTEKLTAFAKEDRRGHRSELRFKKKLKTSEGSSSAAA